MQKSYLHSEKFREINVNMRKQFALFIFAERKADFEDFRRFP